MFDMIDFFGGELEEIRPIICNDINEVAICRDVNGADKFVVVRLKDKEITKQALGMLYDAKGRSALPDGLFVRSVVDLGDMLLIFNYIPDRKLFSYVKSDSLSVAYTISVIRSFVFNYLSLKVAPPIKRLLLAKDNINLSADGKICFGSLLDFEQLDLETSEQDCFGACLDIVNNIILEFDLQEDKYYKASEPVNLFLKKYKNNSYNSAVDIYKDFKSERALKWHFYDNWYAAIFRPWVLIRLGKILVIGLFVCVLVTFACVLLEKSPFFGAIFLCTCLLIKNSPY
ncbi:MAG: hypothetical protein LBJ38_03285 [Oscillospiraceae bacterium]|jgi:hypothetical protein|nr:hypothetical protein [Oscillospiraceae bacterium]